MTDEELEIFREITSFSGNASGLHPLKLDKWWRSLVGAPDPIYLQMGFHTIFSQIDRSAQAVQAMLDLVGAGNLPVSHREIAQRHIGLFTFHVASSEVSGTQPFSVSWDKNVALWALASGHVEGVKMVPDLDKAVSKAVEWSAEIDSEPASEE